MVLPYYSDMGLSPSPKNAVKPIWQTRQGRNSFVATNLVTRETRVTDSFPNQGIGERVRLRRDTAVAQKGSGMKFTLRVIVILTVIPAFAQIRGRRML